MNIEVVSLLLAVVQTLVLVISAILFLYQLRQFDHSLRQDAYTKLADYSMRVNELLLHDKVIADQFNHNNADYGKLNDEQRAFYNYLAVMLGLYERLYLLFQSKRIDQKNWEAWERWLVQSIFLLDIFAVVWKHERNMYHEDFSAYIDVKYHEREVLAGNNA